MQLATTKLKELLVSPGHIPLEQFDAAVVEAQKGRMALERYLVEKGLISDENLGRIIAAAFNVRFADLENERISEELLAFIPEAVARSQQAIVFGYTKEGGEAIYKVASSNPDNYTFFKLLEQKIGHPIEIYYATPVGIEEALKYYRSALADQIKDITKSLGAHPEKEKDIVELVNLFLEYAHDSRASDIHIEPLTDMVAVRYRIDGMLHGVADYPNTLHDKVVFRIKIMARLRTDEHAAAQDGRFTFVPGKGEGGKFDVRVSVMPVSDGENVVMRILAESTRRLSLEELGLSPQDLTKLKRAMAKPHGMILAVGPTGSGKTTTLYSILQILNQPEVNIMTIEDPVEYDIEHVQQTQVNAKKNLTFATGLRSIVRQDPDIIMVGEIRDTETADIAINAAMTGHLLLSTLHANDAATTFPRLIEMQVEPFLVTSSMNAVVAQRLVRKICERCRISYPLSKEEFAILESRPSLAAYAREISGTEDLAKIRFFKGAGCTICSATGYSGRTGIFEVMEITQELRPLITGKASSDVIDQKARELGMTSMLYDGMTKVFQGGTTFEEVIRATKG